MALSKGVNFKTIHDKFKTTNCKELQESFTQHQLELSTIENNANNKGKMTKGVPAKKPKLQENHKDAQKCISELDELENMRDSYVLKMSQTALFSESINMSATEVVDEEQISDSQVVFEACPEVRDVFHFLQSYFINCVF